MCISESVSEDVLLFSLLIRKCVTNDVFLNFFI